jgi:hypothetical protein
MGDDIMLLIFITHLKYFIKIVHINEINTSERMFCVQIYIFYMKNVYKAFFFLL